MLWARFQSALNQTLASHSNIRCLHSFTKLWELLSNSTHGTLYIHHKLLHSPSPVLYFLTSFPSSWSISHYPLISNMTVLERGFNSCVCLYLIICAFTTLGIQPRVSGLLRKYYYPVAEPVSPSLSDFKSSLEEYKSFRMWFLLTSTC